MKTPTPPGSRSTDLRYPRTATPVARAFLLPFRVLSRQSDIDLGTINRPRRSRRLTVLSLR